MTVTLSDPVQVMSSCLDELRAGLGALDDHRIVDVLRQVEQISRRAQSVMLDAVAEAEARGIATREGFGTTKRLLAAVLRCSAGEARARVEQAAMVGARRAMTGETLAPRLPVTAAALAAGEIGAGQLRVITETMTLLPASVPEPARERAEADLAGYARDFDPRRLRIIAQRMLDVMDPDGPGPREDSAAATPVRGELWLRERRDGRLGLEGWLDAEHGNMVRSLIEQLAARRPSGDRVPDTRTVPQRHADALIELCDRARATDDLPTNGGERPHLTVTIDWDALRTALGTATLDYGQLISAATARRLACDCKLIPVVLGSDSEPLDVGRAMRTVPLGIRRALIARDRGCSFPGCGRPPRICDAHHARHWIDGGETSVGIVACCARCTTSRSICKAGTSPSTAGASNSGPPRLLIPTADPSPIPSGADQLQQRKLLGLTHRTLLDCDGVTIQEPKAIVRQGYDALSYHYRSDDATEGHYQPWIAGLRQRIPANATVLDLGCGCGVPMARSLTAAGYAITGVDLSDVQIRRARQLVPRASFIRADVTTLDFPTASFDAIICLFALIHLPLDEQPPLLARIATWLKPGGWFLATTGHHAWTGTSDNWLNGGTTMWWSHADTTTYRSWITHAGLSIHAEEFIPDDTSGHTLFWAHRPSTNRTEHQDATTPTHDDDTRAAVTAQRPGPCGEPGRSD